MPTTPAQVARQANVSVQSVRNWTRDYSEFLSPQARGEHGPRLFNDADVELLLAIASLRRSGVPPAEVPERLRDKSAPPIVDIDVEASPQQSTETLKKATDGALALHMAHNTLKTRVEAVEARLEAQATEAKAAARDRMTMLVLGIVLGVVLVIALQLLALGMPPLR
jgi:DNA-binding transcriptional MerR regulator